MSANGHLFSFFFCFAVAVKPQSAALLHATLSKRAIWFLTQMREPMVAN
jgi:hypothetical protein